MTALLIGYARCSTDQQDLTAQRDGLAALGVADNRVYVDHGLTSVPTVVKLDSTMTKGGHPRCPPLVI